MEATTAPDVHQWLSSVADPVKQGDVGSETHIPPPITAIEDAEDGLPNSPRDPTPHFSDDGDDDDDWQPQTHGRDETARAPKRKHQATVEDEIADDNDGQEEDVPKPKKKAKTKAAKKSEEDGEGKTKRTPAPHKPKPYNAMTELDRKADTRQKRLANAPNKHLKKMGTWDFVKVGKGGAKEQDRKDKIDDLKEQITDHDTVLRHINSLDPGRDLNGKQNKFDLDAQRKAIPEDKAQIGDWRGKSWKDDMTRTSPGSTSRSTSLPSRSPVAWYLFRRSSRSQQRSRNLSTSAPSRSSIPAPRRWCRATTRSRTRTWRWNRRRSEARSCPNKLVRRLPRRRGTSLLKPAVHSASVAAVEIVAE